MIFLVDAQLPPALANWLAQQGHTAQHVDDLGLRKADDVVIWNWASSSGAIIVTKDEDFAERTARTESGPVIVWLRKGNATNLDTKAPGNLRDVAPTDPDCTDRV